MMSRTMQPEPPNYQTFILRFWEERQLDGLQNEWRFYLENPNTRERHGFASMERLMEFLRVRTDLRESAGSTLPYLTN